jgi:hypothetical protein
MKTCTDTEHNFFALDLTDRPVGPIPAGNISPKYVLCCQKCGKTVFPFTEKAAAN